MKRVYKYGSENAKIVIILNDTQVINLKKQPVAKLLSNTHAKCQKNWLKSEPVIKSKYIRYFAFWKLQRAGKSLSISRIITKDTPKHSSFINKIVTAIVTGPRC